MNLPGQNTIQTRDELIYLLTEAAALEHSLTCQYLFAALSLKRDTSEGLTDEQMNDVANWERFILMVARQEMEHLGLVNNLLTAIGASPHLLHDNFPYPTQLYANVMALECFSEQTLRRFICFERPANVRPEDAYCMLTPVPPPDGLGGPTPVNIKSVGELYEIISSGFQQLTANGVNLFIGPPKAQVTPQELMTYFPRVGTTGGVWDIWLSPITDYESAQHAIELIVEQGEGSTVGGTLSHYATFVRILKGLQSWQAKDPNFQPARPVVPNPALYVESGEHDRTLITNEDARLVLDLFNGAYETMLLMLIRFFANTDEGPTGLGEMAALAFSPWMTMVIRPLSEVLTSLPAFAAGGPQRAGPTFEIYHDLHFLPHERAAWQVIFERMREMAAYALQISQRPNVPERMKSVAESLRLIAVRFQGDMKLT